MEPRRHVLLAVAAATLVATLSGAGAAMAVPSQTLTRHLIVATPDPALLSALVAAFASRGSDVVQSAVPLHHPTDVVPPPNDLPPLDPVDVVWLCDPNTNANADQHALCVRPQGRKVIVRPLSMPSPLSAADAAAVALSVEVALLSDGPSEEAPPHSTTPAVVVASLATPAPVDSATERHRHPPALTLDLDVGARRAPVGTDLRAGVEAVYMPARLGHAFGLGVGVASGPSTTVETTGRGPGPAPTPTTRNDVTFSLFVRGRRPISRLWLDADLGPALHLINIDVVDASSSMTTSSQRRVDLSVDGSLGVLVPLDRFFAGVRLGTSYILINRARQEGTTGKWGGHALIAVGVGWL